MKTALHNTNKLRFIFLLFAGLFYKILLTIASHTLIIRVGNKRRRKQMEPIMKANKNGYRLEIFQDEAPDSPRNWDNLGKMICFGKHGLGDEHDYRDPFEFFLSLAEEILGDADEAEKRFNSSDWQEIAEFVENSGEYIMLPLYLYDHSGLTMQTYPYPCPWDSGLAGWIYVDRSRLPEEQMTAEQATKYLQGEVKTYNQYLTGDVYGYVLEQPETCPYCKHVENVHVDSCWGLFGLDGLKEQILGYLGSEFGELVEALA
jgi:hypothetical protein